MKTRKWIVLSAALLLLLLSAVNIYGVDEAANAAADTLYELGLFAGTGTDADGKPIYSLEKPLNRQEAMVMFLNLLGEAGDALEGSHEMPFTDVDEWAKPFIAYAYEKGYTAGVAADRFGAHDPVTRDQYHTYLLLALGYEQGTDFAWNSSAVFAREKAGFNEVFVDGPVLRGHAVRWNANAIAVPKKGEETCMAGAFEGKPADAVFIPATEKGFLFTWKENGKAVTAFYGTDAKLIDRFEVPAIEADYETVKLQPYDIGDGRSFGYYYGLEGLFRLQEGRLQQLSTRPVAQMTFTRQGAVSSGPIILTFARDNPIYSYYQLFGGDTILEIKEDGTENVMLHANTGHGIRIDKIWPADSVIHFCTAEDVGMGHFNEYTYALLSVYNESTGKYRPSIVVLNYTAGRPETEPDGAAAEKIRAEQQRLNDLKIGVEE